MKLEISWHHVWLRSITILICISQICLWFQTFPLCSSSLHESTWISFQIIVLRAHKMLISQVLSVWVSQIIVSQLNLLLDRIDLSSGHIRVPWVVVTCNCTQRLRQWVPFNDRWSSHKSSERRTHSLTLWVKGISGLILYLIEIRWLLLLLLLVIVPSLLLLHLISLLPILLLLNEGLEEWLVE
jgi:hypothetical protein